MASHVSSREQDTIGISQMTQMCDLGCESRSMTIHVVVGFASTETSHSEICRDWKYDIHKIRHSFSVFRWSISGRSL